MKCLLSLQLPTPDNRYGHIVAASSDREVVHYFCAAVIAEQERSIELADDPFEREFQRIRLEQLKARLAWATCESP